ncbi:hypothetical protein GGR57DRAFT_497483 [Xylariaceae sp. FL1272]|nr:hypothetical protein GGR57DRAFT_497483 [Xylariaceae sp. FL1272]
MSAVTVVVVMVVYSILVLGAFAVMAWPFFRQWTKRMPIDDVEKGIGAKDEETYVSKKEISKRATSIRSSISSDGNYEAGLAKLRDRFKALFKPNPDDDDNQIQLSEPARIRGDQDGMEDVELDELPSESVAKTSALPYPKEKDDNIPG